jgi:uncharacterized protein YxjI
VMERSVPYKRSSMNNYPLDLSFKLVALAPQITVTDVRGQQLLYVKQKAFKLKESVTVFADQTQRQPLFSIQADRVFDISAQYHFTDPQGRELGSVRRHGMKSLWRAHYEILDGAQHPVMTIREENPWVKVLDSLLTEIPLVGMFTGYILHPTYLVARADGVGVLRVRKCPAFFEGKFRIEQLGPLTEAEERQALLALLMMLLLERARG